MSLNVETIRLDNIAAVAACLTVCDGCKLLTANLENPNRCEFVLQGTDLEATVADFMLGRIEGNLLEFMRNFDDLRTIIYNHKRALKAGVRG